MRECELNTPREDGTRGRRDRARRVEHGIERMRDPRRSYTPPAPANFRDWKHSLQNTGRPCVGLKGTVVSLPQAEQLVCVSTRSRAKPPPDGRLAPFAVQLLQRFGSVL